MKNLDKQMLELCWEIEKFPASEHQTNTVILAGKIREQIKEQLVETLKPSEAQKVAMYEGLLHDIALVMLTGGKDHSGRALQDLLQNIYSWSYAHREGNGELSEQEVERRIALMFWTLRDKGHDNDR